MIHPSVLKAKLALQVITTVSSKSAASSDHLLQVLNMHAVWLASESCRSRIGLLWTSFPLPELVESPQLLFNYLPPLDILILRRRLPYTP